MAVKKTKHIFNWQTVSIQGYMQIKGIFFTHLSNEKSVFLTIDPGFAVSTLLRREIMSEKRVNKCSAITASMNGNPSSV